jgi:hypothetical protein
MLTRISSSAKRKYRPGLEGLEVKQSLSAGLSIGGAEAFVQATPLAASGAEVARILPCGTGKSIIIITQCEVSPSISHTG